MITMHQRHQYYKGRRTKRRKIKRPHLEACPYKSGRVLETRIVKPKKPNSARRKIAQVRLSNDRILLAYMPGFDAKLDKNSEVMIRGGRAPDLPGIHYRIIRGKRIFTLEPQTTDSFRGRRLSKHNLKNPRRQKNLKKKFMYQLTKERKAKFKDILKLSFIAKRRVCLARYVPGMTIEAIEKENESVLLEKLSRNFFRVFSKC